VPFAPAPVNPFCRASGGVAGYPAPRTE